MFISIYQDRAKFRFASTREMADSPILMAKYIPGKWEHLHMKSSSKRRIVRQLAEVGNSTGGSRLKLKRAETRAKEYSNRMPLCHLNWLAPVISMHFYFLQFSSIIDSQRNDRLDESNVERL